MPYFTPDDLMFIIMDDQRIVIGDTAASTLSHANAQVFINMSESYVNMMLSKRYTIPLTVPGASPTDLETTEWNYVKNIIANRWAYELYTSVYAANIPNRNDFAEEHRLRAEDMLAKLVGDAPEVELSQQPVSESGEDMSVGPATSSAIRQFEESNILTGVGFDNNTQLTYSNLKKGSERIQNAARSTTFVKETDYNIDYIDGKIWALTGGGITSGESLLVTYWYYKENPFATTPNSRSETDEYKITD